MSRQHKEKSKATSSVDEAERGGAPPERDDGDDLDASLRPDPTTPGDFVGPPLRGKENPPDAMDDTLPSLDDEHRNYRHHPSENEAIDFEVDPLAGDAAADLAADLGSQFLEGATRGEDLSTRVLALEDESDAPLDMLLDEEDREEEEADVSEAPPPPPRPAARRRSR